VDAGKRTQNLKEYGGPATEIVSGVVTKADPEDKEENKFSILFTIKSEKHLSLPKSKAQIESYRVARYFKLM